MPNPRAATRASLLPFAMLLLLGACTAPQTSTNVAALVPVTDTPVAVAPVEPPPLPEAIIGLDSDRLTAQLGKPVFLMRAKAAEIWQYRAEGCVLDLYLYEESGALRVLYLEARDSLGASQAPGACIAAVHAARQPWPATAGT
ncbi:MAG: hypothetical protein WD044_02845 [Dongiaceae bacterium]